MTHLYLIRHAEAIEVFQDGKYGVDLGLSPEGVTQAERLRDRLSAKGDITPDVLLSSTARRAQETAQIIAAALGQPIVLDSDLEEWRAGDDSMSPEEFIARWTEVTPQQKPYYHWVEGDESRIEFSLRVHVTLNRILQAHTGKTIVLLTHGAFIQMSFNFFFGMGEANIERALPEVRKTSITHWYQTDNPTRWVLERSNDYQHL
jgi:2,3-bisphosphoglycerate-dependent phosphoglycerate mutase